MMWIYYVTDKKKLLLFAWFHFVVHCSLRISASRSKCSSVNKAVCRHGSSHLRGLLHTKSTYNCQLLCFIYLFRRVLIAKFCQWRYSSHLSIYIIMTKILNRIWYLIILSANVGCVLILWKMIEHIKITT